MKKVFRGITLHIRGPSQNFAQISVSNSNEKSATDQEVNVTAT